MKYIFGQKKKKKSMIRSLNAYYLNEYCSSHLKSPLKNIQQHNPITLYHSVSLCFDNHSDLLQCKPHKTHLCNSRLVTPSSSLLSSFLCVYPSFPERFYGYFSILCYETHASVLFLHYCSSPSYSDPVTYICFDLPVLYFPIDLLGMGTVSLSHSI